MKINGTTKSTVTGNHRNPKLAAKRWEDIRTYHFASIIGKLAYHEKITYKYTY